MFIRNIVNWRMNLFLYLLLLVALRSCTSESLYRNIYKAWWLEQRNTGFTGRQIVRKEVELPNWYIHVHRLYSILCSLRKRAKMDKKIITSLYLLILLAVGTACFFIVSRLITQEKGSTDFSQEWSWFAVWKGE